MKIKKTGLLLIMVDLLLEAKEQETHCEFGRGIFLISKFAGEKKQKSNWVKLIRIDSKKGFFQSADNLYKNYEVGWWVRDLERASQALRTNQTGKHIQNAKSTFNFDNLDKKIMNSFTNKALAKQTTFRTLITLFLSNFLIRATLFLEPTMGDFLHYA